MHREKDIQISAHAGLPDFEIALRRDRVNAALEKSGADFMLFFGADGLNYLTGSGMFQCERPMIYVYHPDGDCALVLPRLELEHAEKTLPKCNLAVYPEYPGIRHPMEYLKDVILSMGLEKSTAAIDAPGARAGFGYKSVMLKDILPEMRTIPIPELISALSRVKTPYEIALLRESARWSQLGHALLQRYTKAGLRELEVCTRAGAEATDAMLMTLGPIYRMGGFDQGVFATYRGQIGKHSSLPHSVTTNAEFRKGDVLISAVAAPVQGYNAELERVMFIGEPDDEQIKYYNLMLGARGAALGAIAPGKKCSDVDREVLRYFKEMGIEDMWRHHSGHGIGQGREAPYFDIGDDSLLEVGMCMSVEPGLYVNGLGGFRLSDTVLITESGFEMLTYFTTDIDKIICG